MTGSEGGDGGLGHGGRGGGTEVIEVWEDRDLFWRWWYRASGDGTKIPSARNYETREAAMEAARLSYPGLPIRQLEAPWRGTSGSAAVGRFLLVVLLVALFGLAVVGAVTVTAVLVALAALRRLRRIG